MNIQAGSTDQTLYFKLTDTAGAPALGLTITDLDLVYIRDRAAAVKADLTALAAVDSAHSDGAAIETHGTYAPGTYRVDVPDAAFAAGVNRVQVLVVGAAIDPAIIECELVAYNPFTASMGLNNLAAGAEMALTEAGILAIWHQLLANITTAGTVGKLIKDYLDAAISSRSAYNPATDEVNVGKIKGASLVETKSSGGSIAAGVSYFFDTDTPGKDMNDVGGGSIELDPEAAAALAADIAAGLLDQPDGGTGKIKVDLRGRVIAAKGGVF